MTGPDSRRCAFCKFYDKLGEETEIGECRRHAPIPKAYDDEEIHVVDAYWPQVFENEWCGDFSPREDISADRNGA